MTQEHTISMIDEDNFFGVEMLVTFAIEKGISENVLGKTFYDSYNYPDILCVELIISGIGLNITSSLNPRQLNQIEQGIVDYHMEDILCAD